MRRVDSLDPPRANPPVRAPAPGPSRRRPTGFIQASVTMGWRWLTRMRTALYLLGILGLQTLLATIVPQAPNVPVTVAEWRAGTEGPGPVGSALIDLVGGYDVYGSPAFLALLLLLFTSLTACLIPRYRAWWRMVRRSQPPLTRHLGQQEHVTELTTVRPPGEALAIARRLFERRRWRVRADEPEDRNGSPAQVAAEKGHAVREGGSLLFHTSFYVLLVAIVLGQLLGFSGQRGVVEGEPGFTDTAIGYWTRDAGRLWDAGDHRGWTMTLDEFHVDWHRDVRFGGQPRRFASDVTFRWPDGRSLATTIAGNEPAVVDGMKVLQLDWGYAPRIVVDVDGQIVHDGFLNASVTTAGYFHTVVKAPAADPGVGLDLLLYPYAPPDERGVPQITGAPWADAPLLVFEAYRGDLGLEAVQNVNQLDKSGLELTGGGVLRPGGTVDLGDGVTVRFPELRRWVGFQVARRPTIPLLLLGAGLVLLGLVPALYAYRRRVWVAATVAPSPGPRRHADEHGRTLVTVAGRAFQREDAFAVDYDRLVRELAAALAHPADDGGRPAAAGPDRVESAAAPPTPATAGDAGAERVNR